MEEYTTLPSISHKAVLPCGTIYFHIAYKTKYIYKDFTKICTPIPAWVSITKGKPGLCERALLSAICDLCNELIEQGDSPSYVARKHMLGVMCETFLSPQDATRKLLGRKQAHSCVEILAWILIDFEGFKIRAGELIEEGKRAER